MRAGARRHFATVERVSSSRSATGDVLETWITVCQLYVQIVPLSGREHVDAAQVQGEVSHRLRARYAAEFLVRPADRVTARDRVFNVLAVLNLGERDRDVDLMCKEVV